MLKEDQEIRSRLDDFGVTREELLTVVGAAVGARRSASAMAPASAGGQLAYIRGTEQLRMVFLPRGWELTRTDNIEAVYNAESGTKIIYQNAIARATRSRTPWLRRKKEPARRVPSKTAKATSFPR